MVYVILAMGLNIVVGYAGLLDLGYAAFFAIGAYTMGFLTSPAAISSSKGWVPECSPAFLAGVGRLLGDSGDLRRVARRADPALRGDYLAIVTLGFGEIVPNFFLNAENIHQWHPGHQPNRNTGPRSRSSGTRFVHGHRSAQLVLVDLRSGCCRS